MTRRRRDGAEQRRSGPPGEARWWDPADQAFAERPIVGRRDLGKGWLRTPMVNNAERLDPFGDDPASERIRAAREARVLTALDEGSAHRHRAEGSLVVARVEVYADPDERAHRAAWQADGAAALDAVWRARWAERDQIPGWIEVRPKLDLVADLAVPADVDWLRVEDQTGVTDSGVVTAYEHLTVWAGRAHAIVVVRHDLVLDLDAAVARLGAVVRQRLDGCPARA